MAAIIKPKYQLWLEKSSEMTSTHRYLNKYAEIVA